MIREEFGRDKFALSHEEPKDFSTCCWQKTKTISLVWVAYRGIMCTYFLSAVLYVVIWWPIEENMADYDKPKLLIYLTFWTFFLESCLFFVGFLVAALDYGKQHRGTDDGELSFVAKMFWVLYSIILSCAVLVTLIFWILIYDPKYFSMDSTNIIMHATNSVLIVIDFFLVAFPHRFLHVYFPYIYLFVYVIFSVVYELSGGTGTKGDIPIYKILDWKNKPLNAFFSSLLCSGVTFVLYFLFSFLYLFKLWLRKKYITKEE